MFFEGRDLEKMRAEFQNASPFPFIAFDNALDPGFCGQIASEYPNFQTALGQGRTFRAVNERLKVQITDSSKFTNAVAKLNDLLSSPKFLSDLSYVTGIQNLLADPQLSGGGMHMTGPGGHLDVHVDFNYIEERDLHRRLNLLLYLNADWSEEWGGAIQLWDKDVKNCIHQFSPVFNRCVIFQTNEISYHGVTPISSSAPRPRISFATYYYTREVPAHWSGKSHSTIFKARPEERFKALVAMPAENLARQLREGVNTAKQMIKNVVGR